ncbi:hypothetical protein HanIR_Chr05g0252091 [Helianthus annuus]|nr:hypothetical protein HanIR_Chr05g0252091 [Helianthus annuus]
MLVAWTTKTHQSNYPHTLTHSHVFFSIKNNMGVIGIMSHYTTLCYNAAC